MGHTFLRCTCATTIIHGSLTDEVVCRTTNEYHSCGTHAQSKSAHQVAELEAQLAVTVEELEQQRRLNHALLRRKVCMHVFRSVAWFMSLSCMYVPFPYLHSISIELQRSVIEKELSKAKAQMYSYFLIS